MPYVSRAKAVRHELAESGSVEEKLAAKDKELHDAKLAVKLKVRLLRFIFDAAPIKLVYRSRQRAQCRLNFI